MPSRTVTPSVANWARAEWRQCTSPRTTGRIGVEKAKQLPVSFVPLGTSLARAGQLEEAHAILDPIARGGIDPFYAAMALTAFGDESAVLTALEQGFEKRSDWMYSIPTQPWFRAYRGHPRFVALLRQMKLDA